MKRSISVKERLDLGCYGHVDRDTLLSPDKAEERATRIPRSSVRSIKPPPPDTERLLHEFKHDCLTELYIDEHPKGDDAFAMAYRLADGDLSVAFNLLSELASLMVPRDPITGWVEVEWSVAHAADVCGTRKARHAAIKSAITGLVDQLVEPDDE